MTTDTDTDDEPETFPSLSLDLTIDTARANADAFDHDDNPDGTVYFGDHGDPRHPDRIAETIIREVAALIDRDDAPYRVREVKTRLDDPRIGGRIDGKIHLGEELEYHGDYPMAIRLVQLYEAINDLPGVTARVEHSYTSLRRTEFGRRLDREIYPDVEDSR